MKKKFPHPDEKIIGSPYSFAFRQKVVRNIENGRMSKNQAARHFKVARSTIEYWCAKMSILDLKYHNMQKDTSPQQEIKKLKQRIEELEMVKDFQQDIIAEFEKVTGKELAKKYLPEHLAKEIEVKKKKLR
jgi:transposase-like protein